MIDKLLYGNAKRVYSDDDGKNYIETKEYDNPVVHLVIATGEASGSGEATPLQEKAPAPVNNEASKGKIPTALIILIAIFALVLLIAYPILGVIGAIVAIVLFVLKKKKEGKNGNS